MLNKQEIERFKRQLLLPEMGESAQVALKNASVLVIGAGGLGNVVCAYLAAAGVGEITIVDNDKVEISNLHRQVMFTKTDIGLSKSVQLVTRLQELNNESVYKSIDQNITESNCIELSGNQDLIIDCVDQIEVRYLLNDVAVFRNISLVYGAIHRFEGQVSVFNFNNSGTYRCAFPEMKLLDKAPSCEEVGVIGVLPGIIGLYQAMEAIKIITGIGKVLADEILMLNLLQTSHVKISYTRNSDEIEIARNRIIEMQNKNEFVNKILDKSEVPAFLVANPTTNVIDIQMDFTYKVWMGVSVLHMPEYAFVQKVQQLDRQCNVLVYCANGIKSTWAAAVMKSLGFKNIYQLSGGIASVIE